LGIKSGEKLNAYPVIEQDVSLWYIVRFWPMVAFDSVLKIAARVDAPTYAGLYEGTWDHPGGCG
jgi:hypothetical protein